MGCRQKYVKHDVMAILFGKQLPVGVALTFILAVFFFFFLGALLRLCDLIEICKGGCD